MTAIAVVDDQAQSPSETQMLQSMLAMSHESLPGDDAHAALLPGC
jgi:hypothetical protein